MEDLSMENLEDFKAQLKAKMAANTQAQATDVEKAYGDVENIFCVKWTPTKSWLETLQRQSDPSTVYEGDWIRYKKRRTDTSFSVDSSFTQEGICDLADLVGCEVFFRLDLHEAKASARTGKHNFALWHNWKASQYGPDTSMGDKEFTSFEECRLAAEEYFLQHTAKTTETGLTAKAV